MGNRTKLEIYRHLLRGCVATLADVPAQWEAWPSMSLRERQDYMLYELDQALRHMAEIEADAKASGLGQEDLDILEAAKRQWEKVKPVVEQMERSFDGAEVDKGEAA